MPQHTMSPGLRLAGQVALVTGAGTGIGQAAALAFAREGARVVLVGRRPEPLEDVRREVEAQGGEALATPADVSLERDVEAVVAAALDRWGRLDCAFNNAGIMGSTKPIAETNEADFDRVIATNLKGAWLMIKHEVRAMQAAGTPGAIVNTSSFLSTAATAGISPYVASKAGLDALIRAVALEVGPTGIRVNNVNPGVIDTPMLRANADQAVMDALGGRAALGRLGTPEDIAGAAVWLCTDEARFVTGQSILVDGGFTIPGPR